MTTNNSTPKDLASLVFKKLKGAKIPLPRPNLEVLTSLFEIMFYSSLKTEESQLIKVTVTFIDPKNPDPTPPSRIVSDRWNCINFKEEIPLTVKNLVKLSKAADPWSSSLAVYYNRNNDLFIWGMIDQAIHYQSFLSYESESGPEKPGLFQTTINGIGNLAVMFDYELIANLKQNNLISNYIDVFKFGPISELLKQNSEPVKKKITKFLSESFPADEYDEWNKHAEDIYKESLSRILIRIQNYQHGGAILLTKKVTNDLKIKHKVEYNRLFNALVSNSFCTISFYYFTQQIHDKYLDLDKKNISTSLYLDETISDYDREETTDEIKGAIRFISSLSCIDGLIVMTPELKVRGFGVVIDLKDIPDQVYLSSTATLHSDKLNPIPSNHFGTRHRSMFSYCWNNPNSLGFVISQDGDIRAVTRLEDKLVVWENIKVLQFIKSNKLARLLLPRKSK
jgi:hypothetical protein